MKEIKAIIRPERFEDVNRGLRDNGYCCMTVYQGEGIGRHGDPQKANPTLDFPVLHSHVVKIEIMAEDEDADAICSIIQECGCTGRKGDGVIAVTTLDDFISIRTGLKGSQALYKQHT